MCMVGLLRYLTLCSGGSISFTWFCTIVLSYQKMSLLITDFCTTVALSKYATCANLACPWFATRDSLGISTIPRWLLCVKFNESTLQSFKRPLYGRPLVLLKSSNCNPNLRPKLDMIHSLFLSPIVFLFCSTETYHNKVWVSAEKVWRDCWTIYLPFTIPCHYSTHTSCEKKSR